MSLGVKYGAVINPEKLKPHQEEDYKNYMREMAEKAVAVKADNQEGEIQTGWKKSHIRFGDEN